MGWSSYSQIAEDGSAHPLVRSGEPAPAERSGTDAMWFKLRAIEPVRPSRTKSPHEYLASHLLLLAVTGEARVSADGCHLPLDPGSAFLGQPGQLLQVGSVSEDGLFALWFDVLEERGVGSSGRPESGGRFPLAGLLALSDVALAGETAMRAVREWRSGKAAGRLRAEAALHELLGGLLEDAGPEETPSSDEALHRTLSYMERHCDRNITIDELAEQAGLSRYYYMRLFKSHYGVSAMDYLTELRINKAKRLMEQSKPRLRDIARQVGYSDEFYFIRKFKQQIGIPPATYLRNRERRVAAYSFPNIGQLLALQIVPFAAPMDQSWTDLYRRKYQTDIAIRLSHNYEFNLTALREAQPDYIVGVDAFVSAEEQERIRGIAPALFVPWWTDDWRGHLRRLAEFLDRTGEAEDWLRRYDRLAVRTREQIRRSVRQEKVLVVHRLESTYQVYGRQTVAGVLYDDLGFAPAGRAAAIESREEMTAEELARFGADRILLMLSGGDNVRASWERLGAAEEWQRTAALLGAARVTPIALWPWFDYSAYTQMRFLQAVPAILRASP